MLTIRIITYSYKNIKNLKSDVSITILPLQHRRDALCQLLKLKIVEEYNDLQHLNF